MEQRQLHCLFGILTLATIFAGDAGCSAHSQGGAAMALQVSSTDFSSGGTISQQFTCDGGDISPALRWNEPPAGTLSFSLIADDPDAPAGTWVHWVVFDLPGNTRSLPQNVEKKEQLESGARQGRNDFGKIGYGGPCPPRGSLHRYFFKVYALDAKLNLKAGATKQDVERAQQGHVLAQGEYMGRYGR